jgi:hypothetical protein
VEEVVVEEVVVVAVVVAVVIGRAEGVEEKEVEEFSPEEKEVKLLL